MAIEQYLKDNIDEELTIKPWNQKKILPVFFRENYSFYEMTILGTQCILLEIIDEMPNIDQLQKHIKKINNLTDLQVVLLYKEITWYRRKSLIENRVAFVIEDGQMYLPFLGLHLKNAQKDNNAAMKKFTTPAQVAYLHFLYHKDEVVTTTEYSQKMGISMMTASRALNNLYHANLLSYEIGGMTGRSKKFKRISDPDYFLRGLQFLKNPVRKTVYTKIKPYGALTAGTEALAELSMINPPDHPVMAMDRMKLNEEQIEVVRNNDVINDGKLVELELWDYDPLLFSNNHHVDLLSLYLSLKDETDERMEQALEEILRGKPWYTD